MILCRASITLCNVESCILFCRLWFHPDRQHCLVANTPQWERGSCLLRGEIHRCPKFHNEEEFVGVPTSHFYDFHPAHRCPFHDVSCSLVSPLPISFPFSPGLSLTLKSRWPEMILLDPTFPQEGNASMFSVSFVIIIIIIIIIIIMSSIIILNRPIHRKFLSETLVTRPGCGRHKRQSTWPPACRPTPPESFPLFNTKKTPPQPKSTTRVERLWEKAESHLQLLQLLLQRSVFQFFRQWEHFSFRTKPLNHKK